MIGTNAPPSNPHRWSHGGEPVVGIVLGLAVAATWLDRFSWATARPRR